jgi:ubiquinone/menaquinone biosynthesis C-methylase UbiE
MQTPTDIKACCAAFYESDWARLLLGDSFHPGGLALTGRLGQLLDLQPSRRVLDVAAGKGTSAIFLAQRFGCQVVGVDYGLDSVKAATDQAAKAGVSQSVYFEQGDAERLRFPAGSFDAVICECAFCTFPDKATAATELARVLYPGGRIGLSDLTRSGPLPPSLEGLLAWIACLADARPVEEYTAYFEQAGLAVEQVEAHNAALGELVRTVQGKLLSAEVLVKLKQLDLPGADFDQAKTLARAASEAVRRGQLGYALMVVTKT